MSETSTDIRPPIDPYALDTCPLAVTWRTMQYLIFSNGMFILGAAYATKCLQSRRGFALDVFLVCAQHTELHRVDTIDANGSIDFYFSAH